MATMRDSDEILLKGLRDTVCADVSAADWDLVLKAVTDAGDVRNVRGMARTILFDAVEKASFASRSEAGRYAANQRWKGHTKGGGRRGLSAAEAEESDLKPYADPKVADARGGLQMQAQAQDPPDGREAAKRRWAEGQAKLKAKREPFLDLTDIDPEGKLDKPSGGKVPLASPPSAKQLLDLEERATAKYERQGMTTSDAQGAASADSKRNYGATADELLEQMDRGEARRMLADREKGMSADRKAELGAKFPKAGMVVDIPSKPRTAEESARIQANFEIARAASKKKKKG